MEEERNNIPEQEKICKIGVKEKIDKDKRDNILELFKTPWSPNRLGWVEVRGRYGLRKA